MIELRNSINSKYIPENENPKKVVNIVEKIPDFNKQQKGQGRPLDLATHIKIFTPKQMLQWLPIALAQVKAGSTSKNLLNEIRQTIYSLYRAKEVTKKVYNIMNSIKLWNRMDAVFMNSENSKTSDPQRLLPNLTDKIKLKRSDKYVALTNLSIYYTWKNIKKSYKNNKFKISAPTWNEEFKLPDGSYSVSNIQDYYQYIFKNLRQLLIMLQ